MSAPDLPRVESVPGQLTLQASVREVLARAHFERFVASTHLTATWESVEPRGQHDWGNPVEHLVPAVHELVDQARAERRHRLLFAIGSVDRTLAAGPGSADGGRVLAWCGYGIGEWECSREQDHPRDVHAAGDGIAIVAACAVLL